MASTKAKESVETKERRASERRLMHHLTKIRIGNNIPLRDCLILDISDRGVRLYVGNLDVPDRFNLLIGEDVVSECSYEVIWRRDREIGAKLVSVPSNPA
jgi:PilZ domain